MIAPPVQHGKTEPGPHAPGPRDGLIARLIEPVPALLSVLVMAGLLLKGVGEVVSDRRWWSQWLEWAPNIIIAAGALGVLLVALAFAKAWSIAAGRPMKLRRGARLGRAAWVPFLVYTAYTTVTDAPFYRPRPRGPASGLIDDSVRLVFWNAAAGEDKGWDEIIAGAEGDVVVLVGLSSRSAVTALKAAMPAGTTSLECARFTVLSVLPVHRFGFTTLNITAGTGLDPRLPEGRRGRYDPGAAMYFEVGGKKPGDPPRVFWAIDLPSDLSLPRWEVASQARAAIDSFQGQRMVHVDNTTWTIEPGTGNSGPPGFPAPDVIVGDFNIPRGARSLSHLNMGYPDAFDQASTGYMASWPRRWPKLNFKLPLLHLDQAFIGPGLRAWRYQLLDVGSGTHLMQAVDLTAP